MQDNSSRSLRLLVSLYLACYVLWIACAVLDFWIVLQLRSTLVDVVFLKVNPWVLRAVDNFGSVFLSLLWLVAVLCMESYLRRGVERGRLWSRAARLSLVQAVPLALV